LPNAKAKACSLATPRLMPTVASLFLAAGIDGVFVGADRRNSKPRMNRHNDRRHPVGRGYRDIRGPCDGRHLRDKRVPS